jgi:hypothetical protein
MECVVSAVMENRLGAPPVAAEFLRRLDVAGTVDRLCPGRDIAHLTHGQVIETLVANPLTAPAPLWRVEDWAREWAVEEVFGIDPELLNDDRLGRALDTIAPHLAELTDRIGARAIGEFGIDVSTCHRDMTSMPLHGAYPADDQDEEYPRIKHGHPKDRRYDLKQIQTGLAVTGDGGIPLLSRVIDGGAAEISQITGTVNALRAMAKMSTGGLPLQKCSEPTTVNLPARGQTPNSDLITQSDQPWPSKLEYATPQHASSPIAGLSSAPHRLPVCCGRWQPRHVRRRAMNSSAGARRAGNGRSPLLRVEDCGRVEIWQQMRRASR